MSIHNEIRRTPRSLSLTSDHIAHVHRVVEDAGPPAGILQQTESGYADWVRRTVDSHPASGAPTQLFAYGSLIWKPEIEHVAEKIGVARGWHRSFCLRQHRFRGSGRSAGANDGAGSRRAMPRRSVRAAG